MATKRLSRTVLEGGSRGSYNTECEKYTRSERTKIRCELRKVAVGYLDPDGYVDPERKTPWGGSEKFTDKLNALHGYLRSRAGRPWNDVFSDLAAQFDVRSLAGYHVFKQHIQSEVIRFHELYRDRYWRRYYDPFDNVNPFHYIDEDGILRYHPGKRPAWKKKKKESS